MRLSILACAVVLGAANASIEPTFAAQSDTPDANYVTNFNLGGDNVGTSNDGDGGDSGLAGDGGSAEGGQGDENSNNGDGDAGGNDGDGEGSRGAKRGKGWRAEGSLPDPDLRSSVGRLLAPVLQSPECRDSSDVIHGGSLCQVLVSDRPPEFGGKTIFSALGGALAYR